METAAEKFCMISHAAGLICRSQFAGRGLQVMVSLIQKVS